MRAVRLRLSAVMFIQWFAMGLTLPILGHYLKNTLDFTPTQVGFVTAMPAIASMLVPLFATRVADRWISSERFLALCHLVAGAVILLLARQHSLGSFLPLYLIYAVVFGPTTSLSNAIAFHHISDTRREYGRVRLWGTAGWIAAGLGFGLLWLRGSGGDPHSGRLAHALVLSGITSLILSAYAYTLPVATKHPTAKRHASGWISLTVLSKPGMAVLFVLSFLTSVLNQYYQQWMSPFLSQIGYTDSQIMPLLTLGQFSEIVAMANLGAVLARLGIKRTLALGTALQMLRVLLFATNGPAWLLIVGISLHGLTYTFFYATALIYVDSQSGRERRAGGQFLYHMVFSGAGSLVGSLAAGRTAEWLTIGGTRLIDFHLLWLTTAGLAALALVVLSVMFREAERPAEVPQALASEPEG